MSCPSSWLLSGVTGGLGAKILHDMLAVHQFPPSSIVATACKESKRLYFEYQGLEFRVLDYDDPKTLHSAL
ncbi:hypothetical protein M433DRAFT_224989 [Acidomyces richmondensis BFW]|jgi:hypothetical protein|nr:MAG: hypothetical protein FE78DRAFT_91312 [Acidomyces sp. 'richmondensis']KYG40356.1 hypothetical protein M433DRAFT_224989 [Acidomyces richmondensis BFW]